MAEKGYFSELDVRFSEFLVQTAGSANPELGIAAALVSRLSREGDVCLDLSSIGQSPIFQMEPDMETRFPDPVPWYEQLMNSPAVGRPGDKRPLILDQNMRLYLYRYWEFEHLLAASIMQRSRREPDGLDIPLLRKHVGRLFPLPRADRVDWQKIAAIMPLIKNLSIVSGGPGTGKTHTITNILALLLEQAMAGGAETCRIKLAAPTGKAASKLSESVNRAKKDLNCSDRVKGLFPVEAATIHRMLKLMPGRTRFFYNRVNPIPADAVVIDEASMIDLPLMSKLFQAIPDHARIILVGDRDQLASVEAGAALGDICTHARLNRFSTGFCEQVQSLSGEPVTRVLAGRAAEQGLHDCMIRLTRNYRFAPGSGIGELGGFINRGEAFNTLELLDKQNDDTIRRTPVDRPGDLEAILKKRVIAGFTPYLTSETPEEALACFKHFMILCVLKKGPFGVSSINRIVARILAREGLIHIRPNRSGRWYAGRPVLIKSNDYHTGLFNGDIGITLPVSNDRPDDLLVYFSGQQGDVRTFSPFQLPEHETVYAMTVHKAQGSEFDRVSLIFPDKPYALSTRELLYTAVTRARKGIEILGRRDVIQASVERKIDRTSGLRDALKEGEGALEAVLK